MKFINRIKKNKMLMFLGVLIIGVFIALIARFTYAYLAASINEARENVTINSDETDKLDFEIGEPLSIDATPTTLPENGANLVDTTTAKAILTANSTNNTAEYSYWVYFTISNNTFIYSDGSTPEIILTVTDPTGNPVTNIEGLTYGTFNGVAGFDITTQNGTFAIASDYAITSNSSTQATEQTWNFTLTYLNLSFDQSANFGNSMTTEVSMTKEENVPTIADVCTSGANLASCIVEFNTLAGDGADDIYYHDADLANGAQDNSYRYSGANPNNYVCFGATGADCQNSENQYRIIGVFNNQVKLIKATSYGDYAWDGTSSDRSNTWDEITKPDIYATLNTTYYNTIPIEWQNLIAESTWQVGGMAQNNSYTAKQYYDVEVGTGQSGYEETMKIGLMYVSDYGYGANPEKWTTSLYESNYGTDNWLYLGNDEWLISRLAETSLSAFRVVSYDGGYVHFDSVYNTNAVRPSFSLASTVEITSGTGSSIDPFVLNLG